MKVFCTDLISSVEEQSARVETQGLARTEMWPGSISIGEN